MTDIILTEALLDQQLLNFIDGLRLPGRLLFTRIGGSHGLNLATPDSDVDYLGVYAASTWDVLGLRKPTDTLVNNKPDYQIHEVGKFCNLLMKGNPGVVEMLFADHLTYNHKFWTSLRAFRQDFLTAVAVKQYLGYAQGQLRRLREAKKLRTTGGRYNTKWAYHLMRLVGDALRIARGQEPVVWKTDEVVRGYLLGVRAGKYEQAEIEEAAAVCIAEIDGLKPWPISEVMPYERLNCWLLTVRRVFMHEGTDNV